jgi:hypothetical protein
LSIGCKALCSVDFFDSDTLTGEDQGEIDLLAVQAPAA